MAKHLPGKVARLIGDLRTVFALVNLVEHEMEKRIIARHAWVKIDSLLNLLPRLKNEYRRTLFGNDGKRVSVLEKLISRLQKDYDSSNMSTIRDAVSGHSLKLDLLKLVESWRFMSETTFGVIASDIEDLEKELVNIAGSKHICAGSALVEISWLDTWRQDDWLGDPNRPRFAVIYSAFSIAGIAGPLPGGHSMQDVTIRAVGLATFMRQIQIMLEVTSPGSIAERLFAEMMVNDFCALWELLFHNNVRNDYGDVDQCVLDHWRSGNDPIAGAACLALLQQSPPLRLDALRKEVRNKVSAHVDPDSDIWIADIQNWPMSLAEIIDNFLQVVDVFRRCAQLDIRTKVLFVPPTFISENTIALDRQEGRHWSDS